VANHADAGSGKAGANPFQATRAKEKQVAVYPASEIVIRYLTGGVSDDQ